MSYKDVILADGPSHYWRLGETSGLTAADQIATGNAPGTISGGVTLGVPGPLADGSTAMTFNGTSGKVQVGSVTLPAIATVELWVKPTSDLSIATRPLVTWGSDQHPTFYTQVVSGPKKVAAVYDLGGNGNTGSGTTGVAPLAFGIWHHVVYLFTGTTVALYVDGALDASTPAVTRTVAEVATVQIGGDPAFGDGRAFSDASLAEVAVYPLVLTPAQIAAHYAARLATAVVSAPASASWGAYITQFAD